MKKGRMFYKVFIPIFMLGVGLVISFGTYIYLSTVDSVIERVGGTKQSFITQIKNTLEQKIQTVEYAFNTFSTTTSFQDIVGNPFSAQDFQAYRSVNSQLNYIASMGVEGMEYSLISLQHDWRMRNGRLSELTEEDKQQLHRDYIDNRSGGLFWTQAGDGIRLVITLPFFSRDKQAIAMSDISNQALERILQTDQRDPIYIMNKQGETVYERNTSAEGLSEDRLRQVAAEASEGNTPAGTVRLGHAGGQPLDAIYAKSSYNNWVYVTVLDPAEVAQALGTARFGFIMMGLIITLLIAAVAYVIAVVFTKPIKRIQRILPESAPTGPKNEIDWIIHSIDNILTEKRSLETLLEAEMPQLETRFIQNVFRGRLTREELEQGMERFGYGSPDSALYIVMLTQLDNYGNREAADRDLLLLAINKIAEECIPQEKRMLPIILNERTQATVLKFEEGDEEGVKRQAFKYAKAMIRKSRELLDLSISIGASEVQTTMMNGKEACEMAKEALHHRLNLGKESIVFYHDIAKVISGPVLLRYPSELEARLFDAIRLGDEELVSQALYPLLAEIVKHGTTPLNFEVSIIRFVNNLIQLEQLIGVEVLLTQDNSALYHRLLDIRNPEEIERILVEEVIRPMVLSMKDKTSRQFRTLSDKIASIVRAEYDCDLSLETIADRLHYNPNYLSSIFKKEYGTTFSDYLMGYRQDMAKKWLIETDMTIKDIAERLQYHNPQNFIRSFRKKEGVTPGTYRKLKQMN